jgi:hypothetical protein
MRLISIIILLLSVILLLVNGSILSRIAQTTFETRVKHAEIILFGRLN